MNGRSEKRHLHLRAARSRIVLWGPVPRGYLGAFVFLVGGGALAAALAGKWAPAAAAAAVALTLGWLTGLWVWPFSVDAYRATAVDVFEEWAQPESTARRTLGAAVIDRVDSADQADLSSAAWSALTWAAALRTFVEARASARGAADIPIDTRRGAKSAGPFATARGSDLEVRLALGELRAATSRARDKLQRLRVPRRAVSVHRQLQQDCETFATALDVVVAATSDDEVSRAADAGIALDAATESIVDALNTIR